MTNKHKHNIHPAVWDMQSSLRNGKISRREFMRFATLLGTSVGVASVMAACGAQPDTGGPAQGNGGGSDESSTANQELDSPGTIKRGGTFTSATALQRVDHPARLSWIETSNVIRQVAEYLTFTGPDNLTEPYLLESWKANDDLTEWTLNLRKGITFNNGDELTTDDIIFNFDQWLDPDIGSSMLGLLSYLGGMQNIEKVDDYTIKLHLQSPNIGVPEHLFHYPGAIMHRSFEGDFVKQPIGTGGFTLAEFADGERARLVRRDDYWRMGEDGSPLPYLDEVIYISLDKDAAVAALQSGQVDHMYQPRPSDWQALKGIPDLNIRPVSTSHCIILKMRVDLEPWTDVRVRNALKLCQDREKILQLAYFNEGDLSMDAHVAPVHPEYCEKPIPEYNPEKAKELLAEAGYPDGLKVTLATKNNEAEPEFAQALKELAAPAGFEIELDITEPSGYWERWSDVDLGISAWAHRPLGTMILPLGYIADEEGKPVAWNETRWVDEEFSEKLKVAEATLDVEDRRKIMCELQQIMQDRGSIGNPFWKKQWNISNKAFQNIQAHPTSYDLLYDVWKDA